ncbi:MAG TPA: hypothetical protein VGI13_00390, partial [Candidatus Acidoferrum sp.]
RTLRENNLRWSIRFESASITTLRAALLSGIGVAAFGIGMIPEGVHVLPQSLLPKLADTEYLLDWRPDCTDRVVSAFASILRVTAVMRLWSSFSQKTFGLQRLGTSPGPLWNAVFRSRTM